MGSASIGRCPFRFERIVGIASELAGANRYVFCHPMAECRWRVDPPELRFHPRQARHGSSPRNVVSARVSPPLVADGATPCRPAWPAESQDIDRRWTPAVRARQQPQYVPRFCPPGGPSAFCALDPDALAEAAAEVYGGRCQESVSVRALGIRIVSRSYEEPVGSPRISHWQRGMPALNMTRPTAGIAVRRCGG